MSAGAPDGIYDLCHRIRSLLSLGNLCNHVRRDIK